MILHAVVFVVGGLALSACGLFEEPAADPSSLPSAYDRSNELRRATAGPELLNPLIAMVDVPPAYDDDPGDFGAAIIVGRKDGVIVLATANHVAFPPGPPRQQIDVEFWFDRGTQHPAQIGAERDPRLDLAVLLVNETPELTAAIDALPGGLPFTRVRSPSALDRHDRLFTIGDPNAIPWYSAPFEPDRLLAVDDNDIQFRSGFIAKGHSGGGLFSGDWYLVGMITADRPPGGRALRIDRIVERLDDWRQPTSIVMPKQPPEPGEPFKDCDDCPSMIALPTGSFEMGSIPDAVSQYSNERPRHTVTIARSIAMGRFEVTAEEFAAFVKATGYQPVRGCKVWHKYKQGWQDDEDKDWTNPGDPLADMRRPLVCVTFADAEAYVRWLRRITGQPYRLPTEAEWEYAARAWTDTLYWWGDDLDVERARANCLGCGSRWEQSRTAPVGSFAPNYFGLHDMNGNVWEWVADCWHQGYEGAPADGHVVWGGAEDCRRVLRSGGWVATPDTLRSANRLKEGADQRRSSIGFRVAKDMN